MGNSVETPMSPCPVEREKIFGVENFTHNLNHDDYAWMALHNHTVDTSYMTSWSDLWSEDGWAKFGNAPVVKGRESVQKAIQNSYLKDVAIMRHNVQKTVRVPDSDLIIQESILSFVLNGDPIDKVWSFPVCVFFYRKPHAEHMHGWQIFRDFTPLDVEIKRRRQTNKL